jgi:hypothetical protein
MNFRTTSDSARDMEPAPSGSQVDYMCHYRLHDGLSSHTHQVRGALLVVD